MRGGRLTSISLSLARLHLATSDQMYFPGDPLSPLDPIFNAVPDEHARMRMVSSFDLQNTRPDWALCYRFAIVLRGRNATPMETK
jgi:protocatechuate 3,4-dioxygenase beta subunit